MVLVGMIPNMGLITVNLLEQDTGDWQLVTDVNPFSLIRCGGCGHKNVEYREWKCYYHYRCRECKYQKWVERPERSLPD